MKRMLILVALWQAACAATADAERTAGCGWTPDPEIHGAHLDTDDCQAALCRAPDLKPRVRDTIEAAARYWGTGNDVLYGWKIRLVDGWVTCYGLGEQWGCTDWIHMTVTITTGWNLTTDGSGAHRCVESTDLIHEVGHLAIHGGDMFHTSSKFKKEWIRPNVQVPLTEPLAYSLNAPCSYWNDYACYHEVRPEMYQAVSSCQ